MKHRARLAFSSAVMLLVAHGVSAQQSALPTASPPAATHATQTTELIVPSASMPPAAPVTGSSSGIQLAIYLCLLVALLGAGSYFLKNGFNFLPPKNKGARKLSVAETRMLGNRQFLVVAEYEGRRMLLGVCPGRIELLSELGAQAEEAFSAHLSERQ
ncbi:MAG TPA: flagellar biosynthetic protein FliO [Chthoniobacterales bacterium]|nr:flagellar biosynthetic protein FliO [Chthoniobacterales bacterium]